MIVRRYVVKDMPEAVMSIRKDLGKDAVILSTKKIRVKKWLGLRWQTRLEVTAAVGGDIPLQHRDPTHASTRSAMPREGATTRTEPPARERGTSAELVTGSQPMSLEVDKPKVPNFGSALASAFDAYELASKTMQKTEPTELSDVIAELASLRAMVTKQQVKVPPVGGIVNVGVREQAIEFLRTQGVDSGQATLWVDEAISEESQNATVDAVMQRLPDVISRAVGKSAHPMPIRSDSRVVAFVGPTGVGKTTTIAKVAALHVLAGQKSIGLLTTDTFRIAAVQQLKTYADILDVPLEVVEDVDTMAQALSRLSQCDLILVDTAGRNFRDVETISATDRLLRGLEPDETILVVSLASKAEDTDALISKCMQLSLSKLLFTKLDETESVGVIPRVIGKYDVPMSYVTTGQNVPDDIDILSLDDILSRWSEVAISE